MRIMSYNIHSGKNMDNRLDISAIAAVIKGVNPDICGLNEVRMRTSDVGGLELAAELGSRCSMRWYFGRAIDIAGGEYGNALLSRHPIIDAETIHIPDAPESIGGRPFEHRCALRCTLAAPEGRLNVIVTHFGLTDAEEVSAVNTVLRMLRVDMPNLLMGDFNVQPDSRHIARLRAAMRDTAGNLPLTFSARRPEIKIDYIFTSFGIDNGGLNTVNTLASDHLPVWTDIEY